MKIILGKQIEEIKKKNSENEKNLLKNRNSEDINDLDKDDIYLRRNTIKNIKLGTQVVYRIYLNHNIVYELDDTINLNLFHSLVPAATTTSIIFDSLENQNISNYNLVGYCDVNNNIAVYNNNTEYLVLNIRNANNYAPTSCYQFLYDYTALTTCIFDNFSTENVTNMSFMFYNCNKLTSLDLSNFDTQNVTNMRDMFNNCSLLSSLDVSSFNTANVIKMRQMFRNCDSLYILDISNFNTQNVTDMWAMIFSCDNLRTIFSYTFSKNVNLYSVDMFGSSPHLVGGNGTTYSNSHTNAEYARVDGENGLPGYFTAPPVNNNK